MKNEFYLKGYHNGNPLGIMFHNIPGENLNNTFFIGSEIEIEPIDEESFLEESKERLLYYLHKYGDYTWMHTEEDKSLKNGIEIITQPMSLRFITLYGFNFIKRIYRLVRRYNYSGNKIRCGLHFHVSRTNFRSRTENILWNIFYRFKNEFIKLSGRNNIDHLNRYCKFPDTNNHWDQMDRYSAINLFPLNTVEYRFPSGLNNTWEWMAWAELFIYLTKYATKVNGVKTINNLNGFNDLVNNIMEEKSIYVKRLLARL